MPTSLYLSS